MDKQYIVPNINETYQTGSINSIYSIKENLNSFLEDLSGSQLYNIIINPKFEFFNVDILYGWTYDKMLVSINANNIVSNNDFVIKQYIQNDLTKDTTYTLILDYSSTTDFGIRITSSVSDQVLDGLNNSVFAEIISITNGDKKRKVFRIKTSAEFNDESIVSFDIYNVTTATNISIDNIMLYRSKIEFGDIQYLDDHFRSNVKYIDGKWQITNDGIVWYPITTEFDLVQKISNFVYKGRVKLASDSNIVLSGLFNVDDTILNEDDRVLVFGQENETENGIYLAKTGNWVRTEDFNSPTNIVDNSFVYVSQGIAYHDTSFILMNETFPITVGITPIRFDVFVGADNYYWGDGLKQENSRVDIGTVDQTRIKINADNIDLGKPGILPGSYDRTTVDEYGRVIADGGPSSKANTLLNVLNNSYIEVNDDSFTGSLWTCDRIKNHLNNVSLGNLTPFQSEILTVSSTVLTAPYTHVLDNMTYYTGGVYTNRVLGIYLNGIRLIPTIDYNEETVVTTTYEEVNKVTFLKDLHSGDVAYFVISTSGPQGLTGLQGNQGSPGLRGEMGIQGLKGEQGSDGRIGDRGLIGAQGYQGVQGPQGATYYEAVPVGAIMAMVRESNLPGYILCDGRIALISAYYNLYDYLNPVKNPGDTTFQIPNLINTLEGNLVPYIKY